METERLAFDPRALRRAAALLREGRLVAFPTETVYGLGARADDAAAVRAIFAAKGRPSQNPLIVHVASIEAARGLAEVWTEAAERLATAFWPGPLTLVVRRRAPTQVEVRPTQVEVRPTQVEVRPTQVEDRPPTQVEDRSPPPTQVEGLVVAPEVAASGPTVALRVPAHPVALALLAEAGVPVAAPSANRSTSISPTTADHVLKSLGGRIDLVLDGGPTGYGIESSIVDVTREPAVLLRHGALSLATLAALVPIVDRASAIVPAGEIARAPGGHARHYAPSARVLLRPAEAALAEARSLLERGQRVGLLARGPSPTAAAQGALTIEALPDDPSGYAAGLYAALHKLEDAGCEVIVIAQAPDAPAWAAIADRLRRASA